MDDHFDIPTHEPLVLPAVPLTDWSRVPPATRRPAVLPPYFGPKKRPAPRRKELHYYQMVTRGLV